MSYQEEALEHQGLLLLEEAAAAENGWMLFACNFPKQPFINRISLTFKRSLGLAEVPERPASDGRLLDEFMSGTVRLCACRPLPAPLSLCSV